MSIVNLKPTNPTQEEFQKIQSYGLNAYDRSPNDYLRFVAKVFTAWRDPEDKILNFDPYDDTYKMIDTPTTTLQATSDKSIIAYVDGFQVSYYFTRLTTDAESTDLTGADNIITTPELVTYFNENGELITINKAKYGEYHRFVIDTGVCFIDNQLIEIKEQTEWWFRVPETKKDQDPTSDTFGEPIIGADGNPEFELNQFIVDQTRVYSLLPNKRYKLILSYEYITQFESNSARIQFVTAETAVDEPYLLIATFETNEYGLVHQTNPVNEENKEIYFNYIAKPDPNNADKNLYYLRDIDNQYLDKKYMANHKNLFKHLQSQLLTVLTDSKIANTFHVKEIKEEIDHSVSSGDFVYYNAVKGRWYPAIVSRQDFDKVHGLYLKNASEGTDLLFTSGIIEVDKTYKIVNAENMVLRNLIPGSEYFLVDDKAIIDDNAPFISPFVFNINEEHFSIVTTVIAKATSIEITLKNNPVADIPDFNVTRTFNLDPIKGEQRIEQNISWFLTEAEKDLIPTTAGNYVIISPETGLVATDKIEFKINIKMQTNELEETRNEIINEFNANDTELILEIEEKNDTETITYPIKITTSDISIQTMNLAPNLIGPQKPISSLLSILNVESPKDYPQFNINEGDLFLDLSSTTTTSIELKTALSNIIEALDTKLFNESPENNGEEYGLAHKHALIGSELNDIEIKILRLKETLGLTESNYKISKMEFQSTANELQEIIGEKRDIYLAQTNTKLSFISQKEILTQKHNAITVKLNELKAQRNSLEETLANTDDDIEDIDESIAANTQILNDINAEIIQHQNEINTLKDNISAITDLITDKIEELNNLLDKQQKFRAFKYRVLGLTNPDYDLEDYTLLVPRSLNSIDRVSILTLQKEEADQEYKTARDIYQDALESYIFSVTMGSITFAEQLILLQDLKTKENAFRDKENEVSQISTELLDQQVVRNGLIDRLNDYEDAILGELFADIQDSTASTSSFAETTLVKFTVKINRVHTAPINFEFIYKQDTNEKMIITIPAGSVTASSSVYLESFPNALVDNGMPKWISSGTDKIINLNKYNESMLNDYSNLTGLTDTTLQNVYTLDSNLYDLNPANRKGTKINAGALVSNINSVLQLNSYQLARESQVVNVFVHEETIESKENQANYYQNIISELTILSEMGETSVGHYQLEIDALNAKILYYTTTEEILNPPVPGSNYSSDKLIGMIQQVDQNLLDIEPIIEAAAEEYNLSLLNLKEATEVALGQYIVTMEEIQLTIEKKEEEIITVGVLFDLFSEKVNLLRAILLNLKSVYNSGIFNGEWVQVNTLPLNAFEYENGLENILLETFEYLSILPYISFNTANNLEYVCSPNGLAYPNDLQSWIFAKSSGKISTRRYPGATSVGIALNNNTLLLNIKLNSNGDISEFLNVYGNASDFDSQLRAIYNIKNSVSQKNEMIMANIKLNEKIQKLNEALDNTKRTVTRLINGTTQTILTTLTDIEMDTLDILAGTQSARALMLRLLYAKYFGDGVYYNPTKYLFSNTDSVSAYWNPVGNTNLKDKIDPFEPELGKSFGEVTGGGLASFSTLDIETLKTLFYRKISLYKEIDTLKYLLMAIPEPRYQYPSQGLLLKEDFITLLTLTLQKERLVIYDNPDPNVLDDFENPAITDNNELVLTTTDIANFNTMVTAKQAEIDNVNLTINTKKINHAAIRKDIKLFTRYRNYLNQTINQIEKVVQTLIDYKNKHQSIKDYFNLKLTQLDQNLLANYKKSDKLPNIMWDIFRITNSQRSKWNYTYLVLRIKGMQQELNNIIVSNTTQYSPINAELNELKIKKNAALTDGSETLAFVYQTEIDALELKKKHFKALLDNYVDEFNVFQVNYGYPSITSGINLTDAQINPNLYIQDYKDYDLSFAFAEYPAYKEL